MEQQNQMTMHAQAKRNTEEALSYLIMQVHSKSLELNQLGDTLLKHARMELYVAQMEQIKFEDLSSTAQKLYENPNLTIENWFSNQSFYIGNDSNMQVEHNINEYDVFVMQEESSAGSKKHNISSQNSIIDDLKESSEVIERKTTQVLPIIKSFDKYKPAYSGDVAQKIYKANTLKPARELVKSMIENETYLAFNRLNTFNKAETICKKSVNNEAFLNTFQHYSKITSLYNALLNGANLSEMNIADLHAEAEKVSALDSLAYTIVSNAEQFREENAEILESPNLTAGNVKQYYVALGRLVSTANSKVTGQEVIKNELSADVASIMAK